MYQDWHGSREFNSVVLTFYNLYGEKQKTCEAQAGFNTVQDWHSSKQFNKVTLDYHNNYAREPSLSEAKAKLQKLQEDIKYQMNTQGLFKCKGFAYKGSTYERVKIGGDCPEFDLDFIISGGEYLYAEKSSCSRSFYELKVNKDHSCEILNKALEFGVISPPKVMQLFYGSLAKCMFIETHNVKMRYHGPAVQLDVHRPHTNELWFQVDLAPAFYLKDTDKTVCFIVKLSNDDALRNMWYKSHSLDEKSCYKAAAGQRKVVLRTLKAMRRHSNQLSGLETYPLKMAHKIIMGRYSSDPDWDVSKTGQRLIDVLREVHSCLDDGHIINQFSGDTHTIKMTQHGRINLKNYIYGLINNKTRMYQLLCASCDG